MDKERVNSRHNNTNATGGKRTNGRQGREFHKNNPNAPAKNRGSAPRDKNGYRGNRNNNQGSGRFYDKDKDADYEKKDMHRKASAPAREKPKEQTTDKMEVVKRLEKEKKAMQKKNQSKKTQQSRPQVRIKRTNNIDWTKEYENDSYDDDDMYYDFR